MPGPAPKPDSQRRRTNKPTTGWNKTPAGAWQHGDVPEPPDGVMSATREVWNLWFGAWWAAWWTPEDVPTIELALRLWEKAQADPSAVTKFMPLADALGLTPKGRYSLRWLVPDGEEEEDEKPASVRRLKVVDKTG